jgi:hypothetical protein
MKIYSAQLKGTTTVSTGSNVSLTGSFTGSIYGFNDTLQYSSSVSSDLSNLESKSASVDISISNINSVTASNIARLSNLESKSASVDISISNINQYTGSNDTKWTTLTNVTSSLIAATGSYATTGSNTFKGTTIISGSTYIQGDFVVFGSSSIQYISASSVSIGTNIVQLNTATPAVRFAGISVQDSGSAQGVTGSIFWDGLCNKWIYSNPSGVGYSGGMLMSGPRNTSSIGNEVGLTCNYLATSIGSDHISSSAIYHDNTITCFHSNSYISSLGSNYFSGSVGIGNNNPQAKLQVAGNVIIGLDFSYNLISGPSTGAAIQLGTNSATFDRNLNLGFVTAGLSFSPSVTINAQTSNTCFASSICVPTYNFTGAPNSCIWADGSYTRFVTSNGERLSIDVSGIACFKCQVCTAGLRTTDSVVLLKNAASDNRYIQFCDTNTGGYRYDFILQGTANGCGFGLYNNTTAAWSSYVTPNGNTGLGGTTSPGGRLEVWQCTNNRLVIDCANVQNEPRISSLDSAGNPQYLTINSYDLKIKSNGSEALRITDKKHLLVGTQTDLSFYSNWDSGVTRIGTSGVLFSYLNNVDNFIISQNYYVNAAGSDVRIASGAASNIYFASGDILFRTIGTGAAESATSWNTPLRLTCTGASLISGCSTFYCTAQFSKMQKSTDGNWYKIPFRVDKNTSTGTATTYCIVDINNMDTFSELIVNIDYGSRLQAVSDASTQISSRMYGVNRFNNGTVAITDSSIPIGGSGNINTHAPITVAVVNDCRIVVKVDFSSGVSYSSFVWGEIRIFSVESLNSRLTIPFNTWS